MAMPPEKKRFISLRNAKIVVAWARRGLSKEELSEKFKLTVRRIDQILYANHPFCEFNKDWEKKKRIARLQNWLNNAKVPEANQLTLQQEIRAELEGNTPGGGGEMKIIIIRDGAANGRAANQTESVSRSISI